MMPVDRKDPKGHWKEILMNGERVLKMEKRGLLVDFLPAEDPTQSNSRQLNWSPTSLNPLNSLHGEYNHVTP